MIMDRSIRLVVDRWIAALAFGLVGALSIAPAQGQELCGGVDYPFPYTDVSGVGAAFCPGIMEAYVTAVTKGTAPTTFSPNATVTRVQMTTFLQRSLDQGLARTSRRAALNQWWTSEDTGGMQTISLRGVPTLCAADGEDIWITNESDVMQVQANTGKVLGTWTGATTGYGVVVAAGKVFIAGQVTPGTLYSIDPTQSPGAVTVANNSIGDAPTGIAFDGSILWTANESGSVSKIDPHSPSSYQTFSTGFELPYGILYDGANIWVTDLGAGTLLKLDKNANILQTISVGGAPQFPAFDGENIWVPNTGTNSITVVQASTGNVVATISQDETNLLNGPAAVTFDGERMLVTNSNGVGSVTVFKAADLSFIANVSIGSGTLPFGACSDGINFWVPLAGTGDLLRF
jgi:hypothetical protein